MSQVKWGFIEIKFDPETREILRNIAESLAKIADKEREGNELAS